MLTRSISQVPIHQLKTTPRVERLKTELLDAPHTMNTELAAIARKAYLDHKDEPSVLKRAYAFAAALETMTLYIRPGELLVGNRTPAICAQNEVPKEWWQARNDPRSGSSIMQYEAAELYPEFLKRLSPEAELAQRELLAGYPAGSAGGFGHIIAGYDLLIEEGAAAIAARARASYEAASDENPQRKANLLAMAITWEAFAGWGSRYAAMVEEELASEQNPVRRAELEQMKTTLLRVPAQKPTNFREAMQALTLMQMALLLEQPNGGSISMGGIDRTLYPFLRDDLASGALAWEEAEELVDSFYVKLMENAVWPREVVMFANLSIGGRDANGEDAVNDLTLIMLESLARIQSTHPMLSVRWHEKMDQAFYKRVCEAIRMGMGLPALFSDPVYEKVLEKWGLSHEDASRYGIVGCVEPAVMGMVHGQTLGGHVNLLMCLELALNDGKTLLSGEQAGPHTGNFEDFETIEDLWTAYTAQVRAACDLNVESVNVAAEVQHAFFGYPFMSGSMHQAVVEGRDLTEGTVVNHPTVCMVGVSNVADAMMAIENQVFKSGRISKAELLQALRSNFEGFAPVRLRLLNDPDKFGNGTQKAVDVFNRLSEIEEMALCRHPGPRGDYFTSGLWATTWHVRMGSLTGASADGRKAGEPLVDGIGAVTGRAHNGPTAVAADVAGIQSADFWQGGYTFNMKFNKAILDTEAGLDRLVAYTNAFFKSGGMQMQINTISKDTLLAAQKDPEHYADLIVRVAGYSAYFCSLDQDVQNEIIERTEHTV